MIQVLKQVAERLNKAEIVWGLGGSLLLKQKGLVEKANDIDLLIAERDVARAHELISEFGPGEQVGPNDPSYSQYFYQHRIGDVSLDLISVYRIRHNQGMYEVPFDDASINGYMQIDDVEVPLSSLEDWYAIYRLLPKKVGKPELIEGYWHQHGIERPDLLQRVLQGVLPDALRTRIETLLTIRRLRIEDETTAQNVLSVQIPSYRVEAEIIGFDGIPPLYDTVERLMACGETFYGYFVADELAGALAYKRAGDVLDIHRMMVHPAHFRKGIASALLQYVLTAETGIRQAVVSTGAANQPAKDLYLRHGFIEVGQREVAPGVSISLFEKVIG